MFYRKGLSISQEMGDRAMESALYFNLGEAYSGLHKFDEAITCQKKAVSIAREIGKSTFINAANIALNIAISEQQKTLRKMS